MVDDMNKPLRMLKAAYDHIDEEGKSDVTLESLSKCAAQLQEGLKSPDVAKRLDELVKQFQTIGKKLQFEETVFELARLTSGNDESFCKLIYEASNGTELIFDIKEQLVKKLKNRIPREELERLSERTGVVSPGVLIKKVFPWTNDHRNADNAFLANIVVNQRNKLAHPDSQNQVTSPARILLILLAASILWPVLREDRGLKRRLAA